MQFFRKIELCTKPLKLHIAWGIVDHNWLKTDTKEAGQGEAGGIIPGEDAPTSLFPETEIVDHAGESSKAGSSCREQKCADEDCVNKELQIGKALGTWNPVTNNCGQVATRILNKCRKDTAECCKEERVYGP
jgi:hypothetical protein